MKDLAVLLIQKMVCIPGIMLVFTLRGFFQAFSSDKLGDPTPRSQGRVTLNPIAHIDLMGFVCILLLGFGWSKPVQVNSRYYKKIRRDCAIQILSGPLGCIVGGFVTALLYVVMCGIFNTTIFSPFDIESGVPGFVTYMLFYAMQICIYLGIFFLLPIPGFDGFRLITNFLPPKSYNFIYKAEKYSFLIFIAVILLLSYTPVGTFVLDYPAMFLTEVFTGFWRIIFAFLF